MEQISMDKPTKPAKPTLEQAAEMAARYFAWYPSVISDEETIAQWARDFMEYPMEAVARAIDTCRKRERRCTWPHFDPYLRIELARLDMLAGLHFPRLKSGEENDEPVTAADVRKAASKFGLSDEAAEKIEQTVRDLQVNPPDTPEQTSAQRLVDKMGELTAKVSYESQQRILSGYGETKCIACNHTAGAHDRNYGPCKGFQCECRGFQLPAGPCPICKKTTSHHLACVHRGFDKGSFTWNGAQTGPHCLVCQRVYPAHAPTCIHYAPEPPEESANGADDHTKAEGKIPEPDQQRQNMGDADGKA